MNKRQFLAAIRQKLEEHGMPQNDVEKILDYYGELIDDRMEEQLTEEEAVSQMGTVDEIISQILMETPLPKLVRAKVKPKRHLRVWEIVLLILGAPVWAPLMMAAVVVLFSIFIVVCSIILSFFCVSFSLFAGGIISIVWTVPNLFSGNSVEGILALGTGLILIGLSILFFFLMYQIALWVIKLGHAMIRRIKSGLIRKDDVK